MFIVNSQSAFQNECFPVYTMPRFAVRLTKLVNNFYYFINSLEFCTRYRDFPYSLAVDVGQQVVDGLAGGYIFV